MLIKEIENFIEDDLIPYLRRSARQMLLHYECNSRVSIEFVSTPYMSASVTPSSPTEFGVRISKGWMLRTAFILCLSDQYWTVHKGKRRIHIATQESAYDSFIFRESVPPDFLFDRSKPIKHLFLDDFEEDVLLKALKDFPQNYRADASEENNLPHSYGLDLPDHLSNTVKQNLLICFSFLCFHEVAHCLERQLTWFKKDERVVISRETLFSGLEESEFRLKAAEVDADIAAVNWTLNSFCNLSKSFKREDIGRVLRNIFLFISAFDLGRQSIRDYQGLTAQKWSHPIPDIRAVTCMYGLFEGLNSGPNKISLDDMWSIFDDSMLHAIRTLEALAILNCGYYILGNSLISASVGRQGMVSYFAISLVMQEELSKIEDQYRSLRANGLEGKNLWLWRPLGFNLSDDVLKEKCQEELEDIFITKARQEQNPEEILTEWLKAKRGEMDKGDTLLFLQHEFPDDIATNTDKYKMDDRIQGRALQIVFNLGGAKMMPSGDAAD